ncbi:MAG: NADP-dependent oxidoreductase [Candidatus Limnocylindrales bacterium]
MRALAILDDGNPAAIRDVAKPEPGPGEVLVRVRAASINGFDIFVANGYLKGMMEHRFPVVIGKDFAGTVEARGEGLTEFAVGDRVFGVVTKAFLGDGSIAEYVTVPVAIGVTRLPDSIDFTTGGALGLASEAALAAADAAKFEAGQVVLIAGATGGVGSQSLELAVRAGALVIATAHSEAERALVTSLGAAEIVDYKTDIVAPVRAAHPSGVDVALHFAGDPADVIGVVKSGGLFVSTLLRSESDAQSENVTVLKANASPAREALDRAAANQAGGVTHVIIQRTYPLAEAAQALAEFQAGTLGKLVIVVD